MHMVGVLYCLLWLSKGQFYPYPPGLLHWHWGNHTIANSENIKAPHCWSFVNGKCTEHRITGPLFGESIDDRWIPSQRASNKEGVSISWRHVFRPTKSTFGSCERSPALTPRNWGAPRISLRRAICSCQTRLTGERRDMSRQSKIRYILEITRNTCPW